MVFEGLDAGDETRRNGDYVGFPHPDADGTALDSVSIPQGVPVAYDGTVLSEVADVTGTGPDIAGILANYDVYGDTGQEKVAGDANVKMRGEVIADLTDFDGTATAGSYLDAGNTIYVVEEVDADDNLYRVQVR